MFDLNKVNEYVKQVRINVELTNALTAARRVITFSPHPDDSEVIAGGYLTLMSSKDALVKLVVISDGRFGLPLMSNVTDEEVAQIRRQEQLEAARVLGINDVEFLNYPDTEVPEPRMLRRDIIRLIRSFGPDVVVTVDPYLPYESHPDHVNTGLAVSQAVLFHGVARVMREYTAKTPPPVLAFGATARPNALVCIDDYMDRKINALRAHRTQFNDELIEVIRLLHSKLGEVVNCRYAEAFRVLRPQELHMNPLSTL